MLDLLKKILSPEEVASLIESKFYLISRLDGKRMNSIIQRMKEKSTKAPIYARIQRMLKDDFRAGRLRLTVDPCLVEALNGH